VGKWRKEAKYTIGKREWIKKGPRWKAGLRNKVKKSYKIKQDILGQFFSLGINEIVLKSPPPCLGKCVNLPTGIFRRKAKTLNKNPDA
jgi:hypothetical protein